MKPAKVHSGFYHDSLWSILLCSLAYWGSYLLTRVYLDGFILDVTSLPPEQLLLANQIIGILTWMVAGALLAWRLKTPHPSFWILGLSILCVLATGAGTLISVLVTRLPLSPSMLAGLLVPLIGLWLGYRVIKVASGFFSPKGGHVQAD